MWLFTQTVLEGNNIIRVEVTADDHPLSYGTALDLLEDDDLFQATFIQVLSNLPFPAYRWETPPLSQQSVDRPFEFVCINSPWLRVAPDRISFREHFDQAGPGDVLVFENLGGDAILIVPGPTKEDDNFSHIASFVHSANRDLQHNLWHQVARTFKTHLKKEPLWLSTAGGGVAWLHVRIDSYPKYYAYSPYKQV